MGASSSNSGVTKGPQKESQKSPGQASGEIPSDRMSFGQRISQRISNRQKVRSTVVNTDEIMAKKGHIAVTGRYICDRPMSELYTMDTKVVGSGMNGPVTLAQSKEDNKKVAVKSFKKKGMSSRKRKELKGEVEIYLALDHPHVARLERVFETDEELHLVMEFMAGGELYDRLSAKKQYNEVMAADTTYQMLLGVGYLHAHSIAHRDLKLENFLYEAQESEHLKLIDFGFAKLWDHNTKMSQACGSVHYVAPEVLNHSYTPKADMWSLGVIVYMLLTGSPPFHGDDDKVLQMIKAGKPQWSSRFPKLSEPAQAFVKGLLVADPHARMSCEQALEHQWIKEKHKLSESTLDLDIVKSLQNYAHSTSFKRAVLSMMAWSLSLEERQELRQLFLTVDAEKKGTITHSELKSVLEENFHVSSTEVESLFSRLDTDNDNEIEYTEFLAATLQGRIKVHQDLLLKTFQRFDNSGTGFISADDLKTVLGSSFEGHEVEELINEADTDHDGNINYEEFMNFFNQPPPPQEAEATAASADVAGEGGKTQAPRHHEKAVALIDKLLKDEASASGAAPGSKTLNRKDDKPMQIAGM